MRTRGRQWLNLGRIALLPPAAFAVHQLRYELAYGSQASVELRETGHSYLHSVVPWLVALLALAAGGFLLRASQAFTRRLAPRALPVSFAGLWAVCVLALIGIFAGQETLEGIFATGHPGGWAAVFGDGGWWAVPVAGCVGLVLATVLHGARWAVRQVARLRTPTTPVRRGPRAAPLRPGEVHRPAPAPLLAGWSSRGPPA
jgi:hypothetical protein